MPATNQSGTNLGPLTTTWRVPETCSICVPSCSTCSACWRAQSCAATDGGAPRDNTACWPPAKAEVTSPAWPFGGWGFYSPGLACPSGYISACTAVQGGRSDWAVEFNLVQGETAIGCCPSGFACDNVNGNTCVFTASTPASLPTAYCDETTLTNVATLVFPDAVEVTTTATNGAVASATATRTMVVYAPMFQLNFKSSDIPASSTSVPGTTTTSSTRATAPVTQSAGSGSGLDAGAIAGICVGAVCGIGLILLTVILFRRKRRTPASEYSETTAMSDFKDLPADLDGSKALAVHEVQGTSLAELPAEDHGAAR